MLLINNNFKHLNMSEEVKVKEEETQQPNAAVVRMDVLQAVFEYLNTKPRGEVNDLFIALQQSNPVIIDTQEEQEVSEEK